jgi:AmmeMemoRadiSam system protein B/AmmeMemoRadiSam system protein A
MAFNKSNMEIRRPMVAGTFYPANPAELSKQVAGFFSNAERRGLDGRVRAIIAPHAGYIYSGQIAADAYKQIQGEQYDTVVVIAPFHGFFKGVSVYSGGGYETPLGVIEIDRELSDRMSQKHPSVYFSTVGHAGSGGRGEHSLEVQLPFLQIVLGNFKLVAMVMGDQEKSTIRAAAEVLAAALKGTNTLLVASTDMSHFYPDKQARRLDKNFETALAAFDTGRIIDVIATEKAEACGYGPVAAVVEATRRIGGEKVEIISYDTSAKVTGDFNEVVGYLSAVITGKKETTKRSAAIGSPAVGEEAGYTQEEKDFLLGLARQSVEAKARREKPEIPQPPSRRLEEKRGIFVTIDKQGMLRGCIGLVQARLPLIDAVAEMAVSAAFEDPRFPPVTENELPELEYEISVLSPLSLVEDISDIVVGRDGLMIRLELHSGLLLPQVATEYGWNRTTFLEQTCLKAGLPKNSYKDPQAQIYRFRVEKF